MRALIVVLAGVLLLSGCAPRQEQVAAGRRAPNVIFILTDDLGYGALGSYGQTKVATPSLDRMAAEGIRFTSFYAGSTVCAPSRAVLMTGKHLGRNEIRGNRPATGSRPPLSVGEYTLAEMMKEAGYVTAAIGKWGLGNPGTPGVPTRHGFDYFYGYLDQSHAHNYYPEFLYRNEERVQLDNVVPNAGRVGTGVASVRKQYSHDLFEQEALQFIDQNRTRPFFLYLALTIPHANNEGAPNGMEVPDYGPYAGKDWSEQDKGYAGMMARLDATVGKILERLQTLGLDENTIVFFTSDNGPHREGGFEPDHFDLNGPLRGIKRDLYEGGIRVPLIVRWPGRIPKGKVTDQTGYFGDVIPTLAELVQRDGSLNVDGVSLAPTLLGRQGQQQAPFYYWEFYEGQATAQAVRMGQWKAIRKPILSGPIELYDLSRDPGETRDLSWQNSAVVDRAREIMEQAHVPHPNWKAIVPQAGNQPEKVEIEYTGSCN